MGGMRELVVERVEWSDSAGFALPDGSAFNAFQSDSYVARVRYTNGMHVLVGLPPGATDREPVEWERVARLRARELMVDGETVGLVDPAAGEA